MAGIHCTLLLVLSCSFSYDKEWVYKEFAGDGIASPALGHDGTIYVGMVVGSFLGEGGYGILYALNPDGELEWTYETERPMVTSPTVAADGTIYIGTAYIEYGDEEEPGYLYAIDPSGTLDWRYPVTDYIGEIALGEDGTIYCTIDTTLHALNPDGSIKWIRSDIAGDCVIAPDGTVYCYTSDWSGTIKGFIHALTPSGEIKWIYECEDYLSLPPAVDQDGKIFISRYEGLYMRVISSEGEETNRFSMTARIVSAPVIGPDGNLYFIGTDELGDKTDTYLYCTDKGGYFNWRFEGGRRASGGLAIDSDGVVYFTSGERNKYHLIAVDSKGGEKWRYKVDNGIDGAPLISTDGTVYIVASDRIPYGVLDYVPSRELHALKTGSEGLADSPWPKYHGNNQNTGRAGE